MGEFSESILSRFGEVSELGIVEFLSLGKNVYEKREDPFVEGPVDFNDIQEIYLMHYTLSCLIKDGQLIESYRDSISDLGNFAHKCSIRLESIDRDLIEEEDYVFGFDLGSSFVTFRSDELVSIYEELCEYERVLKDRIYELELRGEFDYREYPIAFKKIEHYLDMISRGLSLSYEFPLYEYILREVLELYSELSEIYPEDVADDVLKDVLVRVDDCRSSLDTLTRFLEVNYKAEDEIAVFDSGGERVYFVEDGLEITYGPCRFYVGVWDVLDEVYVMNMWIDDIKTELGRR